jgi:coenzyme F420-0:L-glutamate ligase/coenzyme F420-1:gamma-L-glutamate ligase
LNIEAIQGIPEICPGDDLPAIIVAALHSAEEALLPGDIVVLAQKIVSKAEGRYAYLDDVVVSPAARSLAEQTDKDPRIVELILRESTRVVRQRPGLIVSETNHGFVMANAGIDQSNVHSENGEVALLLPLDSDASARALRHQLEAHYAAPIGVIISDSVGRAWRQGTIGQALGSSGPIPLQDLRGDPDREGRPMLTSQVGFVDQLACAAVLVMGEAAEGTPVVRIRGLQWTPVDTPAISLVRQAQDDLFR